MKSKNKAIKIAVGSVSALGAIGGAVAGVVIATKTKAEKKVNTNATLNPVRGGKSEVTGYVTAIQGQPSVIKGLNQEAEYQLPIEFWNSELDAIIPHLSATIANGSVQHAPFSSVMTLLNGEMTQKPILGEVMFNPYLIDGVLMEVPVRESFQNKMEQKWVMTYNKIPLNVKYFDTKEALNVAITEAQNKYNSQNLPTWYISASDQKTTYNILFDGKETGLTMSGNFSSATALSTFIKNLKNPNNELFIKGKPYRVIKGINQGSYQLPMEFWNLKLNAIIPHLSVAVSNSNVKLAPFSSVLTLSNGQVTQKPIFGEVMFKPYLIDGVLMEVPVRENFQNKMEQKWVMTYNKIPLYIQYFDTKEALDVAIAEAQNKFNSKNLPTWYIPPTSDQEKTYNILFDGKETGLTMSGKFSSETALSTLIKNLENSNI